MRTQTPTKRVYLLDTNEVDNLMGTCGIDDPTSPALKGPLFLRVDYYAMGSQKYRGSRAIIALRAPPCHRNGRAEASELKPAMAARCCGRAGPTPVRCCGWAAVGWRGTGGGRQKVDADERSQLDDGATSRPAYEPQPDLGQPTGRCAAQARCAAGQSYVRKPAAEGESKAVSGMFSKVLRPRPARPGLPRSPWPARPALACPSPRPAPRPALPLALRPLRRASQRVRSPRRTRCSIGRSVRRRNRRRSSRSRWVQRAERRAAQGRAQGRAHSRAQRSAGRSGRRRNGRCLETPRPPRASGLPSEAQVQELLAMDSFDLDDFAPQLQSSGSPSGAQGAAGEEETGAASRPPAPILPARRVQPCPT
eukprot:SAG11_NODE_4223_length_2002_cov_3.231618_1_plen_365_part_00